MTLQALAVALLAAAAAGGATMVTSAAFDAVERGLARAELETRTSEAFSRFVEIQCADATPEADSIRDFAAMMEPGVTVVDVSSRLNPNYLDAPFLDYLRGAGVVKEGITGFMVCQRRYDEGLVTDARERFGDFFTEEALESWIGCLGYANVNCVDETALERLYAQAKGSTAGWPTLQARFRQFRTLGAMLPGSDFRGFFGTAAEGLFPALCAEAQVNVNTADPYVLELLLAYPGFAVRSPRLVLEHLRTEAANDEIDEAELRAIVGKPEGSKIYAYLGTRTWFWRLAVSIGGREGVILIARIPSYDGGGKRFRAWSVEYR